MGGPFNPQITPVKATIHYNDITERWHVTVSRQFESGSGARRQITRQEFTTFDQALTYISVFWGNA